VIRRALLVIALAAAAGCVRKVILSPPDAGVPDSSGSEGVPPDASVIDTNGTLPDAAVD
jgi:hypothetical protein